MHRSIIPTGRWIPIDQWIQAVQTAQHAETVDNGLTFAEVERAADRAALDRKIRRRQRIGAAA